MLFFSEDESNITKRREDGVIAESVRQKEKDENTGVITTM